MPRPRRIFGVDFSGGERAGQAMWIAEGEDTTDGLRLDSCRPAAALPGSGIERARCFPALVNFVVRRTDGIFGLDFPFSIAAALIDDESWEDYVLAFPQRYATAEAFRADCRRRAAGKELKRPTDRISKVPFAAYNLRLYRQTYYGIAWLLHPLVRDGRACVLPMQRARAGRPWLIEICPASSLKALDLYPPYKGRDREHRLARQRILRGLIERGLLLPPGAELTGVLLDNRGGDALDSVIAAVATRRALAARRRLDRPADAAEALEGRVFF